MVTTPEPEKPEPTREERLEGVGRNLIAGHPRGAVRRIVLYAIVYAAIGALGGTMWFFSVIGMVALTLLALTDQLA